MQYHILFKILIALTVSVSYRLIDIPLRSTHHLVCLVWSVNHKYAKKISSILHGLLHIIIILCIIIILTNIKQVIERLRKDMMSIVKKMYRYD